MSSSYTPDEAWFLYTVVAEKMGPSNVSAWDRYFFHSNDFGYGGAWWGLYSVIVDFCVHLIPPSKPIFGHVYGNLDFRIDLERVISEGNNYLQISLWVMRSLAFCVGAIFALLLARRSLSEPLSIFGLLILLSTPMMYWAGKVASPELFGVFLLLISIVKYIEGGNNRWFILTGFACGIKLTGAPVALVFAIVSMIHEGRRNGSRSCIGIACYSVAGAVLANLYILANPSGFVGTILKYSHLFPAAPWELSFKYGPLPFWEGGTYGNLAYWFGSLAGFGAAVVLSIVVNVRLGLSLVCASIAMFAFMLTQPLHNWYWFSVVGAAAIPMCFAQSSKRRGWHGGVFVLLAASVVLLNCYYSVGEIKSELWYRDAQIMEHDSYGRTVSCVDEVVRHGGVREIYDMATIGRILSGSGNVKIFNYIHSFNFLPQVSDAGEKLNRLAVLGPRSKEIFGVKGFIENANLPSVSRENCGDTLLVRF